MEFFVVQDDINRSVFRQQKSHAQNGGNKSTPIGTYENTNDFSKVILPHCAPLLNRMATLIFDLNFQSNST